MFEISWRFFRITVLGTVWLVGFYNEKVFWIIFGISFGLYVLLVVGEMVGLWVRQSVLSRRKFQSTVEAPWSKAFHENEDWFKKLVPILWPHVASHLKKNIQTRVLRSLRGSSSLLSNLIFTDIDLGNRPPHLEVFNVTSDSFLDEDEIILDVNFMYESNCNIEVKVNRFKAGLCDLTLEGVLRVQLCHITDNSPIVGAVTAAFVDDPIMKYDLTQMANLFDLPGFDRVLLYSLSNSIRSLMVLPQKLCWQFDSKLEWSSIKFPLPKGILHVKVIGAHNLKTKKQGFFMKKYLPGLKMRVQTDPYAIVKVGRYSSKSKTISNTIHPMWNESFTFYVHDLSCTLVEVAVYDDDGPLKKNTFLGRVSLPVKTAYERGLIDKVVSMSNADNSKLHIRLQWFELSGFPGDLKLVRRLFSKNGISYTALLAIYVDGADRLPETDSKLDISPVLNIICPNEEFKTKPAKSNSPKWKEHFQTLVSDLDEHYVLFEVTDGNKKDKIGTLKYTTKNLYYALDMSLNEPLNLNDSGPQSILNVKMTLRILRPKEKLQFFRGPSVSFVVGSSTEVNNDESQTSKEDSSKED